MAQARGNENIEKVEDLALSQEDKPKRIDQLLRFAYTEQFTSMSSSNSLNNVVRIQSSCPRFRSRQFSKVK